MAKAGNERLVADAIAALEATTDEMRNMVVMMSADEEGRNEQNRWRRKKRKEKKRKKKVGKGYQTNQIKSNQGEDTHTAREEKKRKKSLWPFYSTPTNRRMLASQVVCYA